MTDQPINIRSWPRAILHVDVDAFFAACEQVIHPELKGKPVITGKERGIVAAASYEAKAKGVTRGMRLYEAKKVCPGLITLPSDYETYSLFSLNMFEIIRRFSPSVEPYSIDEAFADLTGLRRPLKGSYAEIAARVKETIQTELGLTVSCGLSLNKTLAKVGSKYQKPDGFTLIPGRRIHDILKDLPVEKVWGIGPNTTAYLNKLGIYTALEFARCDFGFVKKRFSKPFVETWHELNGDSVYKLMPEDKGDYKSISKVKTFTPASTDKAFVYGQLSRNLENACIKARRHKLIAKRIIIFLRRQDFQSSGLEAKLSRPTAYPADIFPFLKGLFDRLFKDGCEYRSTGVVLTHLTQDRTYQLSLFEDPVKFENLTLLYDEVDKVNDRFGKHSIHHLSSLPVKVQRQHQNERGDIPLRMKNLLKGENRRQRLGVPMIDVEIK